MPKRKPVTEEDYIEAHANDGVPLTDIEADQHDDIDDDWIITLSADDETEG